MDWSWASTTTETTESLKLLVTEQLTIELKKKSRQQLRKKVEDFLEFSENENTTYLNLWDTMKAVLRGKFIALIAYIKNLEILY